MLLQRGFRQNRSGSYGNRGHTQFYLQVLWDHGAGWPGFGGDARCGATQRCHGLLTLAALEEGIQAGLAAVRCFLTCPPLNSPSMTATAYMTPAPWRAQSTPHTGTVVD